MNRAARARGSARRLLAMGDTMTMQSEAMNTAPGVNHNHRVGHIRRACCNPPDRGQILKLVTVEESPITLGEWTRIACQDNAATALLIDQLLQEHADVTGEQIAANLVWTQQDGVTVTTKRLRCKPESAQDVELIGDPNAPASAEAMGIDGTTKGQIIQRQREHEYAMRSYFSAHQTQIAQGTAMFREHREWATDAIRETRELAVTLGSLLKDSWQANHSSQVELDKLRQAQRIEMDRMHLALRESANELDEAEAEAEASSKATPQDAKSQLYAQVGKALEVAMPFVVQAAMAQFAGRLGGGMPQAEATPEPPAPQAPRPASPRAA